MQLRLGFILIFTLQCSAATTFISQSGGRFSGGSACNGQTTESVATFNSGSQSAGQTYELCGTITTGLTLNGSGSSGNVITYLWDTGARISQAVAQGLNLNGASAYLLFDGGIPCGPGTTCDSIEAANQTGYATGQTGIIEATANGSALANQNPTSHAFYGCNGCHDIEIRNLIIRNLYIHSSLSDMTNNIDAFVDAFACPSNNSGCVGGTISIHDSTVHDTGNAVQFGIMSGTTANVYKIDFYRNNWAIANSGTGSRTVSIHDNHFHDATNWDTTTDVFHHNALHNFMTNASDSTALSFYNNLSDGDWGNCCTTATGIFTEDSAPDNFNVFNNVAIQYGTNLAPAWEYAATTGVFANNTALGVATTPSNTYAIVVENGSSGITFENNVIQNYGQYIYVQAGATFTVFDYNTYGPVGMSGVSPWQYGATGASTFSAWKTACSCDSHGQQNNTLGLLASGVPQSGSVVIGAGTNLSSLGLIPLDSGTSAGGGTAPVARPLTGAWAAGAYQPTAALAPSAPSGVTATAH